MDRLREPRYSGVAVGPPIEPSGSIKEKGPIESRENSHPWPSTIATLVHTSRFGMGPSNRRGGPDCVSSLSILIEYTRPVAGWPLGTTEPSGARRNGTTISPLKETVSSTPPSDLRVTSILLG